MHVYIYDPVMDFPRPLLKKNTTYVCIKVTEILAITKCN